MFLDEGLKSSMGTILKDNVIVVIFLNDVVALDNIRMVKLFVDDYFLFEKL